MKKYDIIIFDLDGTLSNSEEGITKSVQYALRKMGIEEQLGDLIHFIGPPLKDECMATYGMSEEDGIKATAYYRERYIPTGIYETEIYPGVTDMLKSLKDAGKYIALATSKPQGMAEEVLDYLNISEYFDWVMGADLHGPRQSKQSVLEGLFQKIQIKNKKLCIMIGDTSFDIDGANAVGIDSIGVEYGFGNTDEMKEHGAITIVNDTLELTQLLLDKE